jgi:hypothetical protein
LNRKVDQPIFKISRFHCNSFRLPVRPAFAFFFPLQKSPIITRQSSVHSSRSTFAFPPPSSSTSKINNHHSTIINPFLALPIRLTSAFFFFHFENHQSSLANHQSIPRLPVRPSSAFFFPLQKSPIITRQSSIHSSPSPFAFPRPSSSTSKITNHHSTIISPFLAFPIRPAFAIFFPHQKSPIITRQSSIHSSPSLFAFPPPSSSTSKITNHHSPIINPILASPFALPPPSSSHFKNHQSSLDNLQSIPRDPHSPFLRLLPPNQKSPIITRQSSVHSSRSLFALPPPCSSTSKITNHHSPIINPFPRVPRSPYLRLLPHQKSPIITRQSSIHSLRSPFARPLPSSSTSKITNHHSPIINPFLAFPIRLPSAFFFHFKNHQSSLANHQSIPCVPHSPCLRHLLPTSKITNHHSTIISPFLAFPIRLPSAFFFHFENHQSSLDNHPSIPRDPPSPSLRLLLPLRKSPIITRHSSIHSSPPHSPSLRLLLPTSKITNHHLTIFNQMDC